MSVENPFEGRAESVGEKRTMNWQELCELSAQGRCNETEMEALKLQAQMRFEHLKNTLPKESPELTLTEVNFEVDFSKKQVLRAVLNENA